MRRRAGIILILLFLLAAGGASGEDPLYTTFSIAARDAATGDLGVAVSTMAPAVGSAVPWARAGVGAVATQAWTNRDFGPRGLDLLAQGMTPREALARLLEADDRPERRQVGMVDAGGVSASHTGRETLPWSGAVEGSNFTVQGNLLTGGETLDAMAESFRSTEGAGLRLSERLLRALEAGQAAGGDRRGRRSAALVVATADPERRNDRADNLRVDDNEDPVRELRRIHDAVAGVLGYRELMRPAGPDVERLQRLLKAVGLYQAEPSGVFDDATVAAVVAFRKARGMYAGEHGGAQGLVDADLIRRLEAAARRPAAANASGGKESP